MAKELVEEPTILDRIEDESDQKQAIQDFRSLLSNRGWKRIVKYYQDVMVYHQAQLNGDAEVSSIESMQDLKMIRFKRNAAERITNLPEILMGIAEMETEDINFDPHYTPDDFNDKLDK